MRRAVANLLPRALRASDGAPAARAASSAPGASLGDYGAAAGVPDHLLQREVRVLRAWMGATHRQRAVLVLPIATAAASLRFFVLPAAFLCCGRGGPRGRSPPCVPH